MINITVEQVTAYINSRYTTYDDFRVQWTALPEDDKEVYVNKSIDEFKKLYFNSIPEEELLSYAISENAIGIMNSDIEHHSDKQFKVMQSLGQAKNTKYNRREQGEIGLGALAPDAEMPADKAPITSRKAWDMIKIYTYGSRRLCIIQ